MGVIRVKIIGEPSLTCFSGAKTERKRKTFPSIDRRALVVYLRLVGFGIVTSIKHKLGRAFERLSSERFKVGQERLSAVAKLIIPH